jgi:hypothetical protein
MAEMKGMKKSQVVHIFCHLRIGEFKEVKKAIIIR